jgi:hypothetical protein
MAPCAENIYSPALSREGPPSSDLTHHWTKAASHVIMNWVSYHVINRHPSLEAHVVPQKYRTEDIRKEIKARHRGSCNPATQEAEAGGS